MKKWGSVSSWSLGLRASLDALRQASDTSYFKDKDALWVKVVAPDSGPLGLGGGTTIQVSR